MGSRSSGGVETAAAKCYDFGRFLDVNYGARRPNIFVPCLVGLRNVLGTLCHHHRPEGGVPIKIVLLTCKAVVIHVRKKVSS